MSRLLSAAEVEELRAVDGLHSLGGLRHLWVFDGGVAAGGGEEWYEAGVLHRVDGPAIQAGGGVAAGGGEQWFFRGGCDRADGPALQTGGGVAGGGGEWWVHHNDVHRVGGPAIRVVVEGRVVEADYQMDKYGSTYIEKSEGLAPVGDWLRMPSSFH